MAYVNNRGRASTAAADQSALAVQLVHGWLASWIAYRDEADAESVPAHVQREPSAWLECGILALLDAILWKLIRDGVEGRCDGYP